MRITDGLVNISVRELVEFVMRSGSIFASFVSRARAVEGTKAHKKIQNAMDANYEKEVKLVHEYVAQDITFVVEGRADGIIRDLIAVTIDEIKSTRTSLEVIDEDYNPLHWAQAKCYAYFYAAQNHLKDMNVRLTYYNLDTKETKHLLKVYQFDELECFFKEIIEKYAIWIRFYMDWSKERTSYLKALTFPFEGYRIGQRELAVNVYKSITNESNLYVNAPTGIGKTISTLFPALKAMGEGHVGKIFYLTAKTITRTVAEKSIQMIYDKGTRVKAITLTAKDKICFLDERSCHPDFCHYAEGHFDRVDEAVYDAITHTDLFTRDVIEDYAKKYNVCPFELSLDLAIYADVVICDYNYIFDPTVALKRFLDQRDFVILVDEAHNLVDRAREMYSESLSKRQFLSVKKSVSKQYPTISKELGKLNEYLLSIRKDYIDLTGSMISKEAPTKFNRMVRQFINECDKKLQKGAMHKLPQDLLELYFRAYNFNKIYEFFDERYITYADQVDGDIIFKLFCMDPSYLIGNMVSACKSVIFFSATLMPIDYYKYMLSGEGERAIALPSPFDQTKSLKLMATDVSTRYQHREGSYKKICEYIIKVSQAKVGNYMVFFPSYKYMKDVYGYYMEHYGETNVEVGQEVSCKSSMEQEEQEIPCESNMQQVGQEISCESSMEQGEQEVPSESSMQQVGEEIPYMISRREVKQDGREREQGQQWHKEDSPQIELIMQDTNMDEEAREAFLAQFEKNPTKTKIGFCVLGGIFSEGIDLTEDRLIGVVIVSVGLPQIGLEKDLIKYHFEDQEKEGYHYAYTYPGMNKVLQAIGRLIRTEKDKGVILLIDDRFNTPLYSSLMPAEYSDRKCTQLRYVTEQVESFWDEQENTLR